MTQTYQAGLYLIAVPVGNLGDITVRALDALRQMDMIACEDTRQTAKLLQLLNVPVPPLFAVHDHNEAQGVGKILDALDDGKRVGFVSDAGMPLISDPGFRVVSAVRDAGYYLTSLPGASSVLMAVQLSGIVSGRFLFQGFLPSKASARQKVLRELSPLPTALVFFEAPHRIQDTLQDMAAVFKGRKACLLRELTKKFETALPFHFPDLPDLSGVKGEIVLVVGEPVAVSLPPLDMTAFLQDALQTMTVKEASAAAAAFFDLPKKEIYAEALRIKDEKDT